LYSPFFSCILFQKLQIPYKKIMNILTFDIEEWFHIIDVPSAKDENQWDKFEVRIHKNVDRILDLLKKKNQKATFFCLGWVGKKHPEIIKKIDKNGHEIASHSNLHKPVYRMNKKEFKKDTEISIKLLEDITGKKIRIYRAPSFSFKEENKWAFEILIELGITIDASVFPAKRSHGGFENFGEANPCRIDINGHRIKEFPINVISILGKNIIFSGGGYFRLLPYPLIKIFMQKSNYVMTYFHPRDFDPNQPILDGCSRIRKFKSYYGLDKSFQKLEKLLNDFEFIDINQADKNINWNLTNVKYL